MGWMVASFSFNHTWAEGLQGFFCSIIHGLKGCKFFWFSHTWVEGLEVFCSIIHGLKGCNFWFNHTWVEGLQVFLVQSYKMNTNVDINSFANKQGKSEGFDSCDRPSNLKLDSNRQFFRPCDREIWWMTLQNNRAPLLCYLKLCASFRSHWWIQTWVTVRKCPIWVKFDNF